MMFIQIKKSETQIKIKNITFIVSDFYDSNSTETLEDRMKNTILNKVKMSAKSRKEMQNKADLS